MSRVMCFWLGDAMIEILRLMFFSCAEGSAKDCHLDKAITKVLKTFDGDDSK